LSLLTVVIVVVAFLVAAGLIAAADQFLSTRLKYPRWVVHFAYGLLALIVVLFVCRELGVWDLLSRVRA
jgi:uncharacterized membrane protein YjjP (DUF1212 family)